jgi:hypothetical protein
VTSYQAFASMRLGLTLLLGGVFFWLAAGRPLTRVVRVVVFALLAAAAVAYPNFGVFHPNHYGHIHYWDVYHYFMGAKYFPELGYTRLYEATYVAGREMGAFGDATVIRDLATYDFRAVATIDAGAVRARFSPARWGAFKRDLAFIGNRIREWPGPLLDRGYNDPPPRALLLHLLVRWIPATAMALTLLTSIDYALVLVAFVVVWRTFGPIPTALAFASLWLSFFARFDFIGGSILRWDWVAALLAGLSLYARGRGIAAGALLGYAVLARIFPVLFLLLLAVKWLQGRLGGVREPVLSRGLAAAAVVLALAVIGVAAAGDERSHLREYGVKIQRHREAGFVNTVGLGPLIAAHTAPWSQGPDGRVYVAHDALLAARPSARTIALASGLYFLAALPLILRAGHLECGM